MYNAAEVFLTGLNPEFGPNVQAFADALFKREHLIAKTVFGKPVTGNEFLKHVQVFKLCVGDTVISYKLSSKFQ